ncbi:hypothetical protein SELMODRAFT_426849 [Selaginella moellendorffii]|uniref:Uncharacterized protein n=1 Tax=Selaginella moellendorffii TaxID=88036 RepID=D8SXQ0_SELML|nr:hypothetical protein SELMODRAFT_426849 [Selaginella moellendorffii]
MPTVRLQARPKKLRTCGLISVKKFCFPCLFGSIAPESTRKVIGVTRWRVTSDLQFLMPATQWLKETKEKEFSFSHGRNKMERQLKGPGRQSISLERLLTIFSCIATGQDFHDNKLDEDAGIQCSKRLWGFVSKGLPIHLKDLQSFGAMWRRKPIPSFWLCGSLGALILANNFDYYSLAASMCPTTKLADWEINLRNGNHRKSFYIVLGFICIHLHFGHFLKCPRACGNFSKLQQELDYHTALLESEDSLSVANTKIADSHNASLFKVFPQVADPPLPERPIDVPRDLEDQPIAANQQKIVQQPPPPLLSMPTLHVL